MAIGHGISWRLWRLGVGPLGESGQRSEPLRSRDHPGSIDDERVSVTSPDQP